MNNFSKTKQEPMPYRTLAYSFLYSNAVTQYEAAKICECKYPHLLETYLAGVRVRLPKNFLTFEPFYAIFWTRCIQWPDPTPFIGSYWDTTSIETLAEAYTVKIKQRCFF